VPWELFKFKPQLKSGVTMLKSRQVTNQSDSQVGNTVLKTKALETLKCPVCYELAKAPTIGTCGHILCYTHAIMFPHCPICRKEGAFSKPIYCDVLGTMAVIIELANIFDEVKLGVRVLPKKSVMFGLMKDSECISQVSFLHQR
jgi:hypothetical protein